jgi:hypothetical protein
VRNVVTRSRAIDYLLKPSLPFVALLTQRITIARATAVAKIRIKQFLAIS